MKNIYKRLGIVLLMALSLFPNGTDAQGNGTLQNPLESNNITDIPSFLFAILDIILIIAVPIIIFFIIYAGFLFVTAQGNTEKLAKARAAFTWAVVGGVVVLGAQLLSTVIKNTVDAL